MKTTLPAPRPNQRGYALLVVFGFLIVGVIMLIGILPWCSNLALQVDRNNHYNQTLAAAEAATEKALAKINSDFQTKDGEAEVYRNLDNYRQQVPNTAEDAWWADYHFRDLSGTADRLTVQRITPTNWVNLNTKYQGLYGLAATYQVAALARDTTADVGVGVEQTFDVATIPIFQFAIFGSVDLEFHPGKDMTVKGRVHSNGRLYCVPNGANLTYEKDVTCSDKLMLGNVKSGDTSTRSYKAPIFKGQKDENAPTVTLPIGTSNTPDDVRKILEVPGSEARDSLLGQQKYYNKADVVIEVTGTLGSPILSGKIGYGVDVAEPTIPSSDISSFINTTKSFYNGREDASVKVTEIDVTKFDTWATSSTNTSSESIRTKTGHVPSSIYVVDKRNLGSGNQSGVRLVNGAQLPANGLTVATPNPLYVLGDFNTTTDGSHFSKTAGSTTYTRPASLCADAITVLSTVWKDSENPGGAGTTPPRKAASDTTVNAAFMAGIVETREISGKNGYSGGVENFPRFLENWTGETFTYNGSMVIMFYSKVATGTWASSKAYYGVPDRAWAFDINFLDVNKLPPCTPKSKEILRGQWTVLGANGQK